MIDPWTRRPWEPARRVCSQCRLAGPHRPSPPFSDLAPPGRVEAAKGRKGPPKAAPPWGASWPPRLGPATTVPQLGRGGTPPGPRPPLTLGAYK
jgi:hypothetical protein